MPLIRLPSHAGGLPQHRDAAAGGLPEPIRRTRAEPGCLRFDAVPAPVVVGPRQVADLVACPQAAVIQRARARARTAGHSSVRIEEVVG